MFSVILPINGHHYDNYCWQQWAKFSFENGLANIYNNNTNNYLPLYHYILYGYAIIQGSVENIEANIYYLKLVTLIFQFITGYYILKLINSNKISESSLFNVLFYLLNIAVLYNAIIWGQVDGIMSCLLFVSVYYAIKHRTLLALSFYLLAINFKLQAIIFLPLIGLVILPQIINNLSRKKLIQLIIIPLFIQIIIILPFILSNTTHKILAVITGSFSTFPVVSMNAYNIWHILLSGNLMKTPDNIIFLGLTYKNWGLIFFFVLSGIALLPLFTSSIKAILNKKQLEYSNEKIILLCSLIPLLFFYLNTQMHERYSHPALCFIISYSIIKKTPLLAFIGCLAYFLNMEGVLKYMNFSNYKILFFDPIFISALYLITISVVFLKLFNKNNTPVYAH